MNIRNTTELGCCICLEPYEESTGHDAVRLNCQHAFGRTCINEWAARSTMCPVCGSDTFPAELSGGLNAFRRLARRIVFICNPEGELFGLCTNLVILAMLVAVVILLQEAAVLTFGSNVYNRTHLNP